MRAEESVMNHDVITERALRLAEEFLAGARTEVLELANDDIDKLRASASALRAAAGDRSTPGKGAEHVAYVVLATAFNEVLASRERRTGA
jgi:hypothetical protein